MKRFFITLICLGFFLIGAFIFNTDYSNFQQSNFQRLYADPPPDDDLNPPDDPILNSPIPGDTVIIMPDGEIIILRK